MRETIRFFLFIGLIQLLANAGSAQSSQLPSRQDVLDSPPVYNNIRTMAEWEETQALTISWKSFPSILKQIVAAARTEVPVIILAQNVSAAENYLLAANEGGTAFDNLDNVEIIELNTNTIWIRDYAANSVYADEVGDLFLVDWIYNRPRPLDDTSPEVIAEHVGVELYATTSAPYDLMNTGGNFMSDGFGTAFASNLVLEENDGNGEYPLVYPVQTEEQIDMIHEEFMGISRYIKMPVLPYDGIHHIDMHMKLLDEETLLIGEYPDGVADGPQINANMEYVLSNFNSRFGTPYKVIRIPMPPSVSGNHPDNNGAYRTYTNGVFVNNTIIIPTYREQYDTTAFRIWGEACPGYNLVGIDCDNTGANIIAQSGAIHCITHAVGADNPLLISHQPLHDTYDQVNNYDVNAYMNHRDGMSSATLFWRTSEEEEFHEVSMATINETDWMGSIPAHPAGTSLHYYVKGMAYTGKQQTRPMPAPNGFWKFRVLEDEVGVEEISTSVFSRVFPNPANAITCVELDFKRPTNGQLSLIDVAGRKVLDIYNGKFTQGISKYFLDASRLQAGMYRLVIQAENRLDSMPLMVK